MFAFARLPARADDRLTLDLGGKPIVLTHVRTLGTARAVAADDTGLQTFLARIGATLTWQPGERYILFTTGEPTVVSFALGDTRYDVGPVTQHAPFAPFLLDGHPYVPLDELIHALEFAIRSDGTHAILQPQLVSLDVLAGDTGTKLVAHAGIPLDARVNAYAGGKLVITFDGVASTLPPARVLGNGPVRRIDVETLGTPMHPQTRVTLLLARGASHGPAGTDDQRDFTMGFARSGAAATLAQAAAATPVPSPAAVPQVSPEASPAAQAGSGPVQVTSVDTQSQNGSAVIQIAVNGNAAYDWHRLRPPDDRFWLDVHNARLAIPPQNAPGTAPVTAVRVHQENPDTVRIALSLADFNAVTVAPNGSGIVITVDPAVADVTGVPHSGSGTVGTGAVANVDSTSGWKFGPRPSPSGSPYVPANPRLIVLDPGHGGSDPGSEHGGMIEKVVTLQISRRVRDILVARGWQVMMTRDTDRDVYKPDDGAVDELQARDDVANNNGARLFVSVHLNAYINDGPHGATVYYYKPSDLALARAVDNRIASEVGIKNDGLVKDMLYVVHHAQMPATLIEAGFDSNPDDRALLSDSAWQQKMAQAIADGIQDYAGAPPPPASAVGGE